MVCGDLMHSVAGTASLSLSKGCFSLCISLNKEGKQPFDKLRDTEM